MHLHTLAHTYRHAHTYKRTHAHTHTHAHIHIYIQTRLRVYILHANTVYTHYIKLLHGKYAKETNTIMLFISVVKKKFYMHMKL